jgi:hypothetical protein
MKQRTLIALVAMLAGSTLAAVVATRAYARDGPNGGSCAPHGARWERRQVPIDRPIVTQPAATPSTSTSSRPARPQVPARSIQRASESEYDSCRRGYYERGIPYDFYACEQLR